MGYRVRGAKDPTRRRGAPSSHGRTGASPRRRAAARPESAVPSVPGGTGRGSPWRIECGRSPRRHSMADPQIRFDDGAGYERYMGKWSRLAGEIFLDWLAAKPGLRWLDVGCGNGAFTERLLGRGAPRFGEGGDPPREA